MPEATMTEAEIQRQEILTAMRERLDIGPEPGDVRPGDVVYEGNDDLDAQMMVASVKSAGVTYIWDTRTGERSRTNNNMLPTQMSKTRPDGSKVFTQRDPGITPVRGQLKCMLHPDLRDEHPELDKWGLPYCHKANLASNQDVKSHMQRRHKREWETIEEDRIEQEKAEDRQMQRQNAEATLAALAAAVANGRAPESEPATKKKAS